jgi:isopropylmalate/homocitrate/citramalate synthase
VCDLYHHLNFFYQNSCVLFARSSLISLSQIICGLARAIPSDIQKAFDAVKYAPHYRIHTFLATSDIHLEHKLKISREECIKRATAVRERNQK